MVGVDTGTSETASKVAHAMKRHKKAVLSPCQKLLLLVGGNYGRCGRGRIDAPSRRAKKAPAWEY